MSSNPHRLMLLCLLLWYISVFVPMTVVVHTPLANSIRPVGVAQTGYLWFQDKIEEIEHCLFPEIRWRATWQEPFYQVWRFLTNTTIYLPLLLGGVPYLKKHPVPLIWFFLGLVVLGVISLVLLVWLAPPPPAGSTSFCAPPAVIQIEHLYPFWPWLLLAGSSTLVSLRVARLLAEPAAIHEEVP